MSACGFAGMWGRKIRILALYTMFSPMHIDTSNVREDVAILVSMDS
jgi:hypothetical protein